jgi:toxin-antitoxin system, toxin component, bro family
LAVNLAVATIHSQNYPDVKGRIQPKMWRGHRVVTYKDISAVHSVPVDQVRKAFFRHRKDMIQGTDYFGLRGREVRDFQAETETLESHQRGGANMLNVFTESGYIKLA